MQNLYAVKGVFLVINIRLFIHFLQMPFIHAYIYLWTFREGNMSFDDHSFYDENNYWFLTSKKKGGSIIYLTTECATVYLTMYFITLTDSQWQKLMSRIRKNVKLISLKFNNRFCLCRRKYCRMEARRERHICWWNKNQKRSSHQIGWWYISID